MAAKGHMVFVAPENKDILLWRYLDFTKFVSMLENGGLFFSRADRLGDPFEGSCPRANEELRLRICRETEIPPEMFLQLGSLYRFLRQWTMISCWHMNEHESAAMWRLYAKTNEAISIQSTYSRLDDCLDDSVFLGVVKYIDYETECFPESHFFYPIVHKRKSFSHEREVRAVTRKKWPVSSGSLLDLDAKPTKNGIWKSVDLRKLIQNIYVAPTAPTWFRELVEQVLKRYQLDIPVKQSSLDCEPFF